MYIIAGPNGAGKTTLSYTILPEIFDVDEFINADEIAKGLSPLNPGKANIRAGRLMLSRIRELMEEGNSFAFETTLSTKSYASLIKQAQALGYSVTLLFLALDSIELAKSRVQARVAEGGHDIPEDVIERRFEKCLANFFDIYSSIVDRWVLANNSQVKFQYIAQYSGTSVEIRNSQNWAALNENHNSQYGK